MLSLLYGKIVMSYLLKNGDAHLKNFGVIYNKDFSNIKFSPAYDIVNTVVYMFKDRPALTMAGKKLWFGRKELIQFGIKNCFLSKVSATDYYNQCITAIKETVIVLEDYIKTHEQFKKTGLKMIDSIKISLNENTIKEIPDEVIRNWR